MSAACWEAACTAPSAGGSGLELTKVLSAAVVWCPLTGVAQADLERVAAAGKGRVDITVGSALDIFGGKLPYADVVQWHKQQQQAVSV
jgi:hypothetical protein